MNVFFLLIACSFFFLGVFWNKTKSNKKISELQSETEEILERYDILTENLAAAVTIRDEEGTIAYCSPYTEVLTGYALSEIYEHDGDFFLSIVYEEDKERYLRALKVTTAGEPFQFRYRYLHKSGIEMWAETRTVPLLDENDTLLSSLSITLDVTGTIRYQKQVEEKNQDLKDFAYMVTHDLKSPIYTIKGMVNLIDEDCKDTIPEEALEPIQHIKKSALRLDSLVSSVLEYSEVTSTEIVPKKVELSEVLSDIKTDFSHQLTECDAELHINESLPTIYGDKLKLYQIFSNLVGNAIKYRSPERNLRIEIKEIPDESEFFSIISIKDNGAGIAEEKLAQIFRPFHRAITKIDSNTPEGSGIGLACVQKLTQKLGGSVSVKSTLGAGSTFIIELKKFI